MSLKECTWLMPARSSLREKPVKAMAANIGKMEERQLTRLPRQKTQIQFRVATALLNK
jgi:hypothetical protein